MDFSDCLCGRYALEVFLRIVILVCDGLLWLILYSLEFKIYMENTANRHKFFMFVSRGRLMLKVRLDHPFSLYKYLVLLYIPHKNFTTYSLFEQAEHFLKMSNFFVCSFHKMLTFTGDHGPSVCMLCLQN